MLAQYEKSEESEKKTIVEKSEKKTIVIGFGLLSKVFGQCAVYPLAVSKDGPEVQPLIQSNGQPITPELNLCNAKGSYYPNPDAFNENSGTSKYPLKYHLSVIYRKNKENKKDTSEAGQKFAELLKTTENQYLLSQVGLVPINRLPPLHDTDEKDP